MPPVRLQLPDAPDIGGLKKALRIIPVKIKQSLSPSRSLCTWQHNQPRVAGCAANALAAHAPTLDVEMNAFGAGTPHIRVGWRWEKVQPAAAASK